MSESLGGASRTYDQPKPHLRNITVKERWDQVKRDNKILAGKLYEITREPPANWHAPKGYGSMKAGVKAKQQGRKEHSKQPCSEHFVDVAPWPPKGCESQHIHRLRHQKATDTENCKLVRKRVELLTSQRPRSASNPNGVWRPDGYTPPTSCLTKWAMRTAMFLPGTPPKTSTYAPAVQDAALTQTLRDRATLASSSGTIGASSTGFSAVNASAMGTDTPAGLLSTAGSKTARVGPMQVDVAPEQSRPPQRMRRPRSAASHVPTTLAMASCAGCGARAYRGADGVHMQPCRRCEQVWYCSEVCANIDWPSHKALCDWHTTGNGEPSPRTLKECWVVNGSLAEVRRELARRSTTAQTRAVLSNPDARLLIATLAGGAMTPTNRTDVYPSDPASNRTDTQPSWATARVTNTQSTPTTMQPADQNPPAPDTALSSAPARQTSDRQLQGSPTQDSAQQQESISSTQVAPASQTTSRQSPGSLKDDSAQQQAPCSAAEGFMGDTDFTFVPSPGSSPTKTTTGTGTQVQDTVTATQQYATDAAQQASTGQSAGVHASRQQDSTEDSSVFRPWPGDWEHSDTKVWCRHATNAASAFESTGTQGHSSVGHMMGSALSETRAALPRRCETTVGTKLGRGDVAAINAQLDEVDALKWVYREMRKKELAMERKQKLIEQRADWGLDGPRPCMYMGGKRV